MTTITIAFTSIDDVNLALFALSRLPYHQVAHLIGNIERQATAQLSTPPSSQEKGARSP